MAGSGGHQVQIWISVESRWKAVADYVTRQAAEQCAELYRRAGHQVRIA